MGDLGEVVLVKNIMVTGLHPVVQAWLKDTYPALFSMHRDWFIVYHQNMDLDYAVCSCGERISTRIDSGMVTQGKDDHRVHIARWIATRLNMEFI